MRTSAHEFLNFLLHQIAATYRAPAEWHRLGTSPQVYPTPSHPSIVPNAESAPSISAPSSHTRR
jgi:hypothetical protein